MRERRWRCCWIYRKLILAVALDQRLPALACHESIIEERKSKGPDVYHLEQLYNSCQVLQGNLDDFFSHENLSYPPSMSCFGNWRSGQKSDLVKIPEKLPASPIEATLVVGALLVDGAAFVNTLKPDQCVKM
ncbi:hypothetical protein OS493_007002 [Desmophyllum pertusum]|uniref:Uncharacterized protein n=1 Tax=Desmophyllum pertusum TaxID=174260 RepID=A0A9X0CYI0_9CNID|nr:hypothetical protein OS493_007002 [Desmophyllum pertusum]